MLKGGYKVTRANLGKKSMFVLLYAKKCFKEKQMHVKNQSSPIISKHYSRN